MEEVGTESAISYAFLVGVACSLAASTLSNTAVNVQKYSHMRDAKLPVEEQRAMFKRWIWWLGMLVSGECLWCKR
jgi:hypothetical protein